MNVSFRRRCHYNYLPVSSSDGDVTAEFLPQSFWFIYEFNAKLWSPHLHSANSALELYR